MRAWTSGSGSGQRMYVVVINQGYDSFFLQSCT